MILHAMTRKKTDDREILISERDNEVLSVAQAKLLKTQDVNYIRTMRLNELKKIEKEKEGKLFGASGKHTVFVDSIEEQESFNPEEFFDTDAALLDNRENRLRMNQLYDNSGLLTSNDLDIDTKNKLDLKKLKQYKLLQRRLKKEKELKEVESIMSKNLEKMKKGNKKKVVDSNGKVHFKWKNERKR
ncbi:conserved hypothetical protein [Candida albicans WO-1]|uniref:U3 small nucleolar RNA-associated protein 11 n=1 Tax=Candida albicans (strain WO-1) TaxID=294748 RepID=C4YLF3_CANAW|nr:conserved hypothetical protein [Candida albicans WO-1]